MKNRYRTPVKNTMKSKMMLLMAGCFLMQPAFSQKKYIVTAPDKSLSVQVTVSDSIYYQVMQNGNLLTDAAAISFITDQNAAGWKIRKAITGTHNETLTPVVPQKSKTVVDEYSSLHFDFSNKLSLEWRVYNNGIAWRWVNNLARPYKVLDEQATLNPGTEARAWYPQEDGFFSHNERQYRKYRVGDIDAAKLASLPALFETKGVKLLLTESGLFNYAGMWVRGDGTGKIRAVFPHYPKEMKIEGDRSEKVVSLEDFIAKIESAQQFPWRILMVAKNDGDLLTNQLPWLLGTPAAAGSDYSWVKPGKVQWDWWHYNNVYNVNFRAGINNDTYKYYIDFASRYHIEYVLLDEGWCDTRDLFKQSKGINIEELAKYAHSKNVDLLLWASWLVLDRQLDSALDQFQKWGIKGIKVDFMQRDDQCMVNYYEKVSKAAAKRKMMVDFHGAYKPTGWSRTYPNVMTSEGVLGNEISKFSGAIDPEHTLTIPFIRMAAGPMDFTPGGMQNVQKNAFAAQPAEPMTLGTRCNQLAMYVMYESPLQMLCDIPTHYYHEPECMQFLQAVPSVWQQTVPLKAAIGEYAAVARQAANGDWYVGAMTNWTARDITIDFSFLNEGKYKMYIWKDGINADRNAKDFAMDTIEVDKNSSLTMKLASGGGYVARLVKQKASGTGISQNNSYPVLTNPVAGGDEYWQQPQKNFEDRRRDYLSFCAAQAKEGGRDGVFSQLARFQLDLPVDEALLREGIAFVYTEKDCSDFTIGGIVRLLYLNKKNKRLSSQLIADLEKCLLDFKYWWDDPRTDLQYRCYHTENHQGLYHTDELLAAQLLGERTFADGKTGKQHVEHAKNLINRWLNYRMRFGFSEWLSNAYYDVEMMTLANLHDFAESAIIRESAGQLLNRLLYDLALNNFHGVFGSTHGRTYAPMITGAWQESTASIMKLMFGVGVYHSPRSMGAVALATSTYRCPEVIEDIATDYKQTILSRQRQSIEVADAAKYGLDVKDELTTHLFWGMQEFIHPEVINMSQYISNRYNTWPYKNYDDYKQKYQAQVAQYGKIVNPYLDRFALSEANIITLRTPEYMLGSAQDYRKGSPGYQQHIWQATLGVDAVVFTNHPASTETGVTPNKWAGNALLPRAAQAKNVLICIYHISEGARLSYSHAYFPKNAFDEVVEKNGWVFGRKGEGYIALYSKQPLQWETGKEGAVNELRAASGDNSWICEMGSASEWKSFEAFVNVISGTTVTCEGLSVVYKSPTQGDVTFGWEQAFTVNRQEIELHHFPGYANQFSHAAFDGGSISINRNGKQVVLEFDKFKSALTAIIKKPAITTPKEVGRLVANRFVNTAHTNFGFKTPPSSITYSEVCAWYGALKFAEAVNDHDLQQRLYQRMLPLLNEKKKLVPGADHVDHTVFGVIPFELYKIKKDTVLFNMGKRFADQQWQLPVNAKPEYVELQNQGFTWQTRFWIDDMYMINLIQSEAYRMTGDTAYINRAAREMIEYLKRLQQSNGLFYHAPDVPFFWGRGNGWMAAGMTELLLSLPANNVYRPAILKGYKTMMESLLHFQSASGMWRQLIDDSTAWPETSCTGMFTYAMITGIKKGWLSKKLYKPAAYKAWQALVSYINPDGDVREICEGTNKKNNRQFYLDRQRITGDMHGQAPVLWCAAAFLTN